MKSSLSFSQKKKKKKKETYMHVLHFLLKHFLLLYFKKLIRTNKLLFLSIETKIIKIRILRRIMGGEWDRGS